MSELDTRALRALMEKATPGEWQIERGERYSPQYQRDITIRATYEIAKISGGGMPHMDADADLIVALVNAAPALLDAADERDQLRDNAAVLELALAMARHSGDALRARVAELQAEVERLREALVRVLMHEPRSTEAAVQQDYGFARAALAPRAEVWKCPECGSVAAAKDGSCLLCGSTCALAPRAEVKP